MYIFWATLRPKSSGDSLEKVRVVLESDARVLVGSSSHEMLTVKVRTPLSSGAHAWGSGALRLRVSARGGVQARIVPVRGDAFLFAIFLGLMVLLRWNGFLPYAVVGLVVVLLTSHFNSLRVVKQLLRTSAGRQPKDATLVSRSSDISDTPEQ